jgi:glutathione peroxidase
MKILIACLILGAIGSLFAFKKYQQKVHMRLAKEVNATFHELAYTSLTGEKVALSSYAGKYILVVNVASKCGYTPQYAPLEELYEKHKDKLVVIGFPCNQFLGQEPGSSEEIAEFCSKNYGVTFPMASKIDVKGKNQDPIYTWLTNASLNGVEDTEVKWNFHKFLISPDGKYLGDFGSKVDPLDAAIVDLIR